VGFLTSLFGGSGNTVVTVILALAIVLVLIVFGLWALKVLFNATNNVGRGRNRRLSLIDSTSIDSKRQLVLVRRDNVEHLLMIGGAQDVVIETGIEPPAEPEPLKRPKRRIIPAPVAAPAPTEPAVPATPAPASSPVPPATAPSAPLPASAAAVIASAAMNEPAVSAPEPKENPEVSPAIEPVNAEARSGFRRTTSLRHTGLLRPASRVEPALHPQPSSDETKNEGASESDSATQSSEPEDHPRVDAPVVEVHQDTDGGNDSADEGDSDKKA